MARHRRDRVLFYVIFTYILASFLWWAILFLRNNQQNYYADAQRLENAWVADGGTVESWESSETLSALKAELRKRNMMILGEGLVFVALISFGFFKIDQSFRREIELTRQQNNFILSITHELKSPLASIKLSMQTLIKRSLGREQVERVASLCLDDTERLEGLVENILMASRLESPDHRFHKEQVNLSSKTRDLVESVGRKHSEANLIPTIQPGLFIHGDAMASASVILNLIENAIKYSPTNEEIRVNLYSDTEEVILEVADRGPGIPEKEKSNVFRRFYRSGNEETRASKGTGLGLFIVQEIVRAHSGRIELLDNSPTGSIFKVYWPRMAERVDFEDSESDKAIVIESDKSRDLSPSERA